VSEQSQPQHQAEQVTPNCVSQVCKRAEKVKYPKSYAPLVPCLDSLCPSLAAS